MILWNRPEGGEVFNLGSIRSAIGFRDERFCRLIGNVLKHFGVEHGSQYAITTTPPADFNKDGRVDMADFRHFAENFGTRVGEERWHGTCDLDGNGVVDLVDFMLFAEFFGQRVGVSKPAAALTIPEILETNRQLRDEALAHSLLGPQLSEYLRALPQFSLEQNYPNPFNPDTTIRYSLAEGTQVDITIYSATGQQVRNLVSEYRTVGAHTTTWDGTDDKSRRVASGVYHFRLTAGNFSAVRRMILLK